MSDDLNEAAESGTVPVDYSIALTRIIDALYVASTGHPFEIRPEDVARAPHNAALAIEAAASLGRVAAMERAITTLAAAVDEVNARYIGGSPLSGERFSAAMDALVLAALEARRSTLPSRVRRCIEEEVVTATCSECGLPTLSTKHRPSGGGVVCDACLASGAWT